MKLTHLAFVMTVGLLGLTSWLAWQQHNDATGLRNQLELARIQQQGRSAPQTAPAAEAPQEITVNDPPPPELASKESQVLAAQMAKGANQTLLKQPTPAPLPKQVPMPHVNMSTANLPPPMTPRQRQLMAMPVIARVKVYDKANGFIVIDAGKNKKLEEGMAFALRRDNAIIGRIKIGTSEEVEAIGDIVPRSVPPGVTLEVGDEVIQDLPPES